MSDKTEWVVRSAEAQPAAPSGAVNVIGMPEFDGLLDHIYEHGTTAEGVIERANAFARAVLAQYAPQQPAACPKCGGTGEADSGGIMPWGAPAMIPCDCQQPAAVDGAMVMVQKHDALILANFATTHGGAMEQLAARRITSLATQQQENGNG